MANSRSGAIDAFRGLGILLVVLGHTNGIPSELHRYVYSFHMPAFFILSGYLFNADKARSAPLDYVRGKFARLVVPAWTIGAICGLLFVAKLALNKLTFAAFLGLLWGTATGFPRADGNFLTTPIWFLFCLFVVEAVAAGLVRVSLRWACLALLSIGIIGLASAARLSFILFDVQIALPAAFFFGIGIPAKRSGMFPFTYGAYSLHQGIALGYCALIWAALTFAANDPVSMSDGLYGVTWSAITINVGAALAGTAMLRSAALVLSPSSQLEWLGRHTLPILGFNYIASAAVIHVLDAANLYSWPLSFLVQTALLVAVAWALDRAGRFGALINGRPRAPSAVLGSRPAVKTRLPRTIEGAFELGYDTSGGSIKKQNPYPPETRLHAAWEDGNAQAWFEIQR